MSPKRASKRYALTRDDRQLDPRESPIVAKGIKVRPVPCLVNGARKFRFELENSSDNIHCLDALAEEINLSGYQVSAVEGMLNMLLDVIPKYIARTGRSVRIGNLFTLKPCATGTIDYANDAPNPESTKIEIRGMISPALRYSLSKVPVVNVSRRTRGIEFAVNDANGGRRDAIDLNLKMIINGIDIDVSPRAAADGHTPGKVWIETLDGRMLGRCEVLSSGPNAIQAKFVPDAPVDVDEGRVFVETGGKRYSHDIRLINR